MIKPSLRLSIFLFVALALSLAACQSSDKTGPNSHLEKGRQALVGKDNELAIKELGSAIQDNPAEAEAYYLRGTAYYGRYESAYNAGDSKADGEDFWRALTDFTRAIELNHNYAEAYHYRGLTHHGLGFNQHSIADYSVAIQLDPSMEYPYYGRALVYEEEGRKEEAIADYRRFLELSQDTYWRAEAQKRLDALLVSPS
jgi:tetratricopeptide (TPR) repeat protein